MKKSRAYFFAVAASLAGFLSPGLAASQASVEGEQSVKRALREMQVYKVKDLGLEIWVENQPPWEVQLDKSSGKPVFLAQSPENYHPPAAMTFTSFPKEKVAGVQFQQVAFTAIRRASQNFGMSAGVARSLHPLEATYGVLKGYESTFYGKVDGVAVDVTVFVGQADGKFPVALSMYTIKDKMETLSEQRRRSWTKLRYL